MSQKLVIGIDLGNSNCSLSYRNLDKDKSDSKMVSLSDGQNSISPNILPTVVLFPKDGSEPLIGQPARDGRNRGLLFENFKERLMEAKEPEAVTQNGVTKSPMDALTALLRFLARTAFGNGELSRYFTLDEAKGQFVPREPISLTLGVPAQAPEHYKNRLRQACQDSGWLQEEDVWEYLSFVAEPVGAALNYEPGTRRHYFIYDHGGLTLDMVRIQVDESQSPPYKVLGYQERVTCMIGGHSYNVGGSILDRLLLRFALARAGGVSALQEKIAEAYEAEFDTALLEQYVQMEKNPPLSGQEARVYADLCRDIERLRIGLSSPERDSAVLSLSSWALPVKTRIVIKKSDLGDAFSEITQAIRQKMPKSVGKDEFCYMVGGCSLTPLFQDLVKETFSSQRVLLPSNPMETIAQGLSKYYRAGIIDGGPKKPVDPIVDTDYGVWNDGSGRYDIVLPKGTAYSDAMLPTTVTSDNSSAIYKVYRSIDETQDIVLRIGQRDPDGKWINMSRRSVHLPTPTTNFRLYFSIDHDSGQLEIRLFSSETKKLIRVSDPRIKMSNTKGE